MSKKKTLIIVLLCAAVAGGSFFLLRGKGSDPESILARADKYFEKEAFDEARIEYINVLRADSKNARALRQLGLTWMEMGVSNRARAVLREVHKNAPDDLEVARTLAKSLFAARQITEARKMALTVLDKDPTDGELLLLLANASASEEQLDEVSARLKELDPAKSSEFHIASAIVHSRKGDIEATKAALDMAREVDPDSVQVHLAFATYYEAKNDPEQVLASLKKASELSASRSSARIRYARALAREGNSKEAESMVREIADASRFYVPAWLFLAGQKLQGKDPKGALADLREVFSRDPDNPEALMIRVSALQAQGKADEATKTLEHLGSVYPGHLGFKMTLARQHLQNGDAARAGAVLNEILKGAPDHVDATMLQAQINLRTGAAIAAANNLEKLLQVKPGIAAAELLLARAYQDQGQFDDAAEVFRNQIARDEKKTGAHFMLGMMLQGSKKSDEARASFETAQALAPKDQAITFQLVDLDVAAKDFAAAHRRVDTQIANNPDDWGPLYLRGRILTAEARLLTAENKKEEAAEKWAASEKALLKALDIKTDSLTVYNLLLGGYLAQNRVGEAIRQLESYVAQDPEAVPRRLVLAMLHEQDKQFDQAAATYEKLVADNPEFVPALNNLAYLCSVHLNDLARAEQLATEARRLAPDSAAIADTLGWILFQRKKYAEALKLLEEASLKDPEEPEIQYHLGMARYMQGQQDGARTALENAVAAEKEFAGKDEARKQLASLAQDGDGVDAKTIEELLALLQKTPGDVVARTRLAQLEEADGKHPEAAANYEKALEGNANMVDALAGLARLYTGPLGDLERAREFATRARTLDSDNPAVARALGEIVLRDGDFRLAYNLLSEARDTAKKDPSLEAKIAEAAYGSGKITEARSIMQGIIDEAGGSPETTTAKRFLALTAGELDSGAEALVTETLKTDPRSLPALMAKAALPSADDAATVGIYEALLKRHPEFVPALKELAILLATNPDRLAETQAMADKARKALPDDPELARARGIISYLTGDAKIAVLLLKESESSAPLDAEGLFYLGMAQLKTEQKTEGVTALKQAIEDDLAEDLRKEAEEAVAGAELAP